LFSKALRKCVEKLGNYRESMRLMEAAQPLRLVEELDCFCGAIYW